ncbi:MAG: hypothetical protein A2Y38_09660 [Spirochaetes bacterium GWB1_59_5]|nr:MAG: hypothetical protein A2Y38_09660 [Spirochaetes bacterium GWB1_59_5]
MRGSALKLVAADLRLVARDPLLAIMPIAPFLAAVALRFVLPPLSGFVERATGFRIMDYADVARVVITLFPGMFFGMVSGFLLLDDRDDGVSMYWGVTPVGRAGYLAARLGLFSVAAFVAALAAARISGFGAVILIRDIGVAAIGSLQVAFFSLFLAAFAANKVEGLALLKAMSGLDMAPLAVYLRLPIRLVAWPFPQYWAAEFALGRHAPPSGALSLGVLASVMWIFFLAAKYRKRVD